MKKPKTTATGPHKPAIPVFATSEMIAYMMEYHDVYHLDHRHDAGCSAIGTGRGCHRTPTVFLRAQDRNLITEVQR